MGTLGTGLAYSACFAENEERSPWEPLHVQKGFKPTDSAVSVFFGLRYVQEGYGPRLTWREKMRRCLSLERISRHCSSWIRSWRGSLPSAAWIQSRS